VSAKGTGAEVKVCEPFAGSADNIRRTVADTFCGGLSE
jgi:hypothetical protein